MSDVVDIIIPVYSDYDSILSFFQSLFQSLKENQTASRLVVIDDCTPEEAIAELMDGLSVHRFCGQKIDFDQYPSLKEIVVIRNRMNMGFVRSVNRGFGLNPECDALILNADTLVLGGWIDKLVAHSQKDPYVGTVTPLSNNATILSYPAFDQVNPLPDLEEIERLNSLCEKHFSGQSIDIPTCVGFCTFINRKCLAETGCFDETAYGRGYAEENDFSVKSYALGWRHVAALDLFVGHYGERSFHEKKSPLIQRNLARLVSRFPCYETMVWNFIEEDPLFHVRRTLDLELLKEKNERIELLVTLSIGGGVAKTVEEDRFKLVENGVFPLIMYPEIKKYSTEDDDVEFSDGGEMISKKGSIHVKLDDVSNSCWNIGFDFPEEYEAFKKAMHRLGVSKVHFHHFLGHHPNTLQYVQDLNIPYTVTLHDYAWICPRVNLIDGSGVYCKEPEIAQCERCVQLNGHDLWEGVTVAELRETSHGFLRKATRLFVPSRDTAERMSNYFSDCRFMVRRMERSLPHENARKNPTEDFRKKNIGTDPVDSHLRVAVIGAIGPHKGYDLLNGCLEDAAERELPIEYVVIGYTADDEQLFKAGNLFITGKYESDDAIGLIQDQQCHVALFLSVWPETWCYCLSQAWEAGLPAVAFDLGAFSERITPDKGWLMPCDFSPTAINTFLIETCVDFESNLS